LLEAADQKTISVDRKESIALSPADASKAAIGAAVLSDCLRLALQRHASQTSGCGSQRRSAFAANALAALGKAEAGASVSSGNSNGGSSSAREITLLAFALVQCSDSVVRQDVQRAIAFSGLLRETLFAAMQQRSKELERDVAFDDSVVLCLRQWILANVGTFKRGEVASLLQKL
jgi:hypothetical protein